MPEPFVSADRRADLFTDLTSRVTGVDAMNTAPFDKKDAEIYDEDFGGVAPGQDEITGADGAAIDEARVTVGQRWVKAAEPVV